MSSPPKRAGSPVAVGILVSKTEAPTNTRPRTQIPAKLCMSKISLPLLALIDSGAEQSFLDAELVSQAGIGIEPLDSPVRVCALDGLLKCIFVC